MNDNGRYEYIVVRCGESEMMVMYGNLGVTLVRGGRDDDGTLVAESNEQLPFADHPELKDLYSSDAWDGPNLLALVEQACLEVSA